MQQQVSVLTVVQDWDLLSEENNDGLLGRRRVSEKEELIYSSYTTDPEPGFGAFLTHGSGIQNGYKIKVLIWDKHTGSYFRENT